MRTDVRVRIEGDERPLESADAQWVHQTIQAYVAKGRTPRVEIFIKASNINVRLATAACGGGGGGRQPNEDEEEIIKLWNRFYLSEPNANLDDVWPFLGRLRQYLGFRAA